jgi:hypothetical protein
MIPGILSGTEKYMEYSENEEGVNFSVSKAEIQ